MKILVLNGPNLNMLGKRDTNLYGVKTLEEINKMLAVIAQQDQIDLLCYQSNHEGALIDTIQQNPVDGILVNPGALTHTSVALRDALADARVPIVEVHLSDITTREDFRKIDILDGIVLERIMGLKEESYTKGLAILIARLKQGQ
jgi:3-dehydroquinate dehydratase II